MKDPLEKSILPSGKKFHPHTPDVSHTATQKTTVMIPEKAVDEELIPPLHALYSDIFGSQDSWLHLHRKPKLGRQNRQRM